MRTPMFDTLRILSTRTVVVHLIAAGAVGCQGEHVALRADMELSLVPGLHAGTIGSATRDRNDIVDPVDKHPVAGTTAPGDESNAGTNPALDPGPSSTQPGASALRMAPRPNPHAEDLLDHWGHRSVETIPESLGLASSDSDGSVLQELRSAAASASAESVAPLPDEGDAVEVLGERRAVRYGRWTGGPADTLSIEFNYENVSEAIRSDPAFRALFERAGKAWSHRIADTWSTYPFAEDTISTGLEVNVFVRDLGRFAGQGGVNQRAPVERFEPHSGSVTLDDEFYQRANERNRLSTVIHELGHVLGAWSYIHPEYTDQENGTWTGPEVVAIHGRPAPFQNKANPSESINGERDPEATEIDYFHSGVCASIMAYCNNGILPHPIDFAFLADIGMTIIDPSDRPETYGFGVWTDHAGATVSVARTLRPVTVGATLVDPLNRRRALGTIDLLEASVDAFGHRSTGDLRLSYGTDTLLGTARFAGGLFGTALELEGLPPVIGDANLEVDLDVLRGDARFTSLKVFERGTGTVFGFGRPLLPLRDLGQHDPRDQGRYEPSSRLLRASPRRHRRHPP